jgi:hypothetical protein
MYEKSLNKYSITEHVTVPGLIEKGVVVVIDQQGLCVGVESETFINAHDCHGRGRDGHCLYVSHEYIKRI